MLLSAIIALGYDLDAINKYASNFGEMEPQTSATNGVIMSVFLSGFVFGIVLCFYAWRAHVIWNNSKLVLLLLAPFALAPMVVQLWFAAYEVAVPSYPELTTNLGATAGLTFSIPFISDTVITLTMLAGLWRSARQGASATSTRILKRIGLVALETNAICTIIQAVALALYLATHEWHFLFVASTPQVYPLCFIIWLLARQKTRKIVADSASTGFTGKSSGKHSQSSGIVVLTQRSQHIDLEQQASRSNAYEVELEAMDDKDRA